MLLSLVLVAITATPYHQTLHPPLSTKTMSAATHHKPHPTSAKSSAAAIAATMANVQRARILAVAPAGHVDVDLVDGFGRGHVVFAPGQAVGSHVVASISTRSDACGKQYITVAFVDGTHADTTLGAGQGQAVASDGPDGIRIAGAASASTATALLHISGKQYVVMSGFWPVKEPVAVTIDSIGAAGMALTVGGRSTTLVNTGATIAPASEAAQPKKKSLLSTLGNALGLPNANAQPSCG